MDVLIYTRNHTPDGKGFVHDNIAASVAEMTGCELRCVDPSEIDAAIDLGASTEVG